LLLDWGVGIGLLLLAILCAWQMSRELSRE
jgi:hypothetical protein